MSWGELDEFLNMNSEVLCLDKKVLVKNKFWAAEV
jgi:hypothetical protein